MPEPSSASLLLAHRIVFVAWALLRRTSPQPSRDLLLTWQVSPVPPEQVTAAARPTSKPSVTCRQRKVTGASQRLAAVGKPWSQGRCCRTELSTGSNCHTWFCSLCSGWDGVWPRSRSRHTADSNRAPCAPGLETLSSDMAPTRLRTPLVCFLLPSALLMSVNSLEKINQDAPEITCSEVTRTLRDEYQSCFVSIYILYYDRRWSRTEGDMRTGLRYFHIPWICVYSTAAQRGILCI